MIWVGVKVGDIVYDPYCDMDGYRWDGEPLSKGLKAGKVEHIFSDGANGMFAVKHDSSPQAVMYLAGIRYDRVGLSGCRRVQYPEERNTTSLFD